MEPRDRGAQALAREHAFDGRARVAICGQRIGIEPAGDGAQVQPGAADQDRDAAALRDAPQGIVGVADEMGDRERFVGLHEIEAVMPNVGAIGRGHLGSPDVEATEHLSRIGRDDLRGYAAVAKCPRERQREACLAGGGRARDDEERGRSRSRVRHPRRECLEGHMGRRARCGR